MALVKVTSVQFNMLNLKWFEELGRHIVRVMNIFTYASICAGAVDDTMKEMKQANTHWFVYQISCFVLTGYFMFFDVLKELIVRVFFLGAAFIGFSVKRQVIDTDTGEQATPERLDEELKKMRKEIEDKFRNH